jgi:glyoxylase-like metal-dependent hydrolase (beta-lactamase superfamily II)
VIKLADGLRVLECPFKRYVVSVGCVFGEGLGLIDSGTKESPVHAIEPALRSMNAKLEGVSTVVLTHGHYDHCGGLSEIRKVSKVSALCHPSDEVLVEDPPSVFEHLNHRFPGLYEEQAVEFEAAQIDVVINGDAKFTIGGRDMVALHAPGHSAGSLCIVDGATDIAFSGDSFQGWGEGRPLLFYSFKEYVESIEKAIKRGFAKIVLGHPFPPFGRTVLQASEVKAFLRGSIDEAYDIKKRVLRMMREDKIIKIDELSSALPGVPPVTAACVLEALETEGIVSQKVADGKAMWTI